MSIIFAPYTNGKPTLRLDVRSPDFNRMRRALLAHDDLSSHGWYDPANRRPCMVAALMMDAGSIRFESDGALQSVVIRVGSERLAEQAFEIPAGVLTLFINFNDRFAASYRDIEPMRTNALKLIDYLQTAWEDQAEPLNTTGGWDWAISRYMVQHGRELDQMRVAWLQERRAAFLASRGGPVMWQAAFVADRHDRDAVDELINSLTVPAELFLPPKPEPELAGV